MSHKQILISFWLTLLTLSSSGQIDKPVDEPESFTFLNPDNFLGDTLYIKGRFTECGEWGGHLELSKIYYKDNEFYFTYQKFFPDCSRTKENNGEPPQTLNSFITKKLSGREKSLIYKYCHQLLDAKFSEPAPTHSGYIFEVRNKDGGMYISVYTSDGIIRDEYQVFIAQLLK